MTTVGIASRIARRLHLAHIGGNVGLRTAIVVMTTIEFSSWIAARRLHLANIVGNIGLRAANVVRTVLLSTGPRLAHCWDSNKQHRHSGNENFTGVHVVSPVSWV